MGARRIVCLLKLLFCDIAGRRLVQWNGLLPAVGHTNVCRPLSMMIGPKKTRATTIKRSPRVMVKNRVMKKLARMSCPPDHPGKSICLKLKTFCLSFELQSSLNPFHHIVTSVRRKTSQRLFITMSDQTSEPDFYHQAA